MILIIGAGVAGLAAAKCLSERNIRYRLVDRYGDAGGAYRRMYPRTVLSSPARYLRLPGDRPQASEDYLSASAYASYLESYAIRNGITPTRGEVTELSRYGTSFRVTFSGSRSPEVYRAVVVCTGMFDNPSYPEVPGLTAHSGTEGGSIPCIHACNWRGAETATGKRVLIIGDGMTAIELAEECVRSGAHPILSTKAETVRMFPLHILGTNLRSLVYPLMMWAPLRMFRRRCLHGWRYRGIDRGFRDFRRRGLIDVRPMTTHVCGPKVTFQDGTSTEADLVVFATGYRFDMPFLPDSMPRQYEGIPFVENCQSVLWPGLFLLGVPCAFRPSSNFVHGIAADAQLVADAVTGLLGSR